MSFQATQYTRDNLHRFAGEQCLQLMGVAMLLASYADDSGREIRPALETLAELLNTNPNRVRLKVRALESVGWLRCVYRSRGHRPSVYELGVMIDEGRERLRAMLAEIEGLKRKSTDPLAGEGVDPLAGEGANRALRHGQPARWRSPNPSLTITDPLAGEGANPLAGERPSFRDQSQNQSQNQCAAVVELSTGSPTAAPSEESAKPEQKSCTEPSEQPEHVQHNCDELRGALGRTLKQTRPPIDEATRAAQREWSLKRAQLVHEGRTPQEIERETGPQPGALIRRRIPRAWLTRTDRLHLLSVHRFIDGELRAPDGALAQRDLFDDHLGRARWYRLPPGVRAAA